MNGNVISNDFLEIITGTTNKLHPAYMEAAKEVDKGTSKSVGYLKNFVVSIENLAAKDKVKDARISSSKGNIKNFKSYEDLKTCLEFLKKNAAGVSTMVALTDIFKALESYQPLYTEGYEKNIRLVVLEYESAVDLLITGLTMVMAENIDVVQTGTTLKVMKNKSGDTSVIHKTIRDMVKQLNDKKHKQYLEEMIKAKDRTKVNTNIKESVSFMEASVADTIELIDVMITGVGKIGQYSVNIVRTIKNSLFGIVPLIRSCLYLRFKKKADTVLALEQQAEFITQNIEQLQNRTNLDPAEKDKIIKKQQATVEAYKKRAAKLRAQLSDTERSAATVIKDENPNMKNTDDDFILEGKTISELFSEKHDKENDEKEEKENKEEKEEDENKKDDE